MDFGDKRVVLDKVGDVVVVVARNATDHFEASSSALNCLIIAWMSK